MPSTSPLPSLTIALRRAEMTAFWILMTAVASGALGLGSAALGLRAAWGWGAVGLGLVLPGLVWPQWFEIGIRAWNKGVRLSAAVLRIYVLKVCYYLLFGAMSRTGSSLDLLLENPECSRWMLRTRHDPAFGDNSPLALGDPWGHGLIALVRRPGRAWMVCLLPVLLLLLLLRDEAQENIPPSGTYTLY